MEVKILIGLIIFDMDGHYERYRPMINGIQEYLSDHPEITNVYVTGHSLGGQMATMFMQEHPDTGSVHYQSVTFEAANKLLGFDLEMIVPLTLKCVEMWFRILRHFRTATMAARCISNMRRPYLRKNLICWSI